MEINLAVMRISLAMRKSLVLAGINLEAMRIFFAAMRKSMASTGFPGISLLAMRISLAALRKYLASTEIHLAAMRISLAAMRISMWR
jgi:hypothetical protein